MHPSSGRLIVIASTTLFDGVLQDRPQDLQCIARSRKMPMSILWVVMRLCTIPF